MENHHHNGTDKQRREYGKKNKTMKVSEQGIKLIHHFESCKLEAYQDSAGIWTIGWGNTLYDDGRKVKQDDKITQQEADRLFKTILPKFEALASSKIKREVKQHEFDAAVSFAYNAGASYKSGSGHWKDYNIWQHINERMSADEIKEYWQKLAVTAGGKTLKGLARRRKAEVHLYNTGELKFFT